MLLLMFYLGEELYAIDSTEVVEIIPRIGWRPIYQAPDYIAGLFNYRGSFVPVVDLRQLIQGQSCHSCLSTRIIIVNYPVGDHSCYLGLMSEKVTDTFYPQSHQTQDFSSFVNKGNYLGKMIMDQSKMIQLIRLQYLLFDGVLPWLWSGKEEITSTPTPEVLNDSFTK
jgi:chemotaxis-related protein WspB